MTTTAETDGPLPLVLPRHRMRIALEFSDVSVQDMADTLGVSRNTVGNYLSGRRPPRLRDLRVWAMRTGVSLEWIQTGHSDTDGDSPDTQRVTGRYPRIAADERSLLLVAA